MKNADKVTPEHKETFFQKLCECQIIGLKQYGKYLDQQLIFASKSEIRKAYKKYIEDQIILNNKRIANITAKL
ncbi:MAG: hypothetical protein ACYDCN_00210 [Bacteroidia bacterium]